MSAGPQPRSGFTLLELMVAAAVGVLVVGGALAVVLNALAWHGRIDGKRQARSVAARVLDQVAQDLAGFCRREGSEVGLAATILDGTDLSGLWEAGANGQLAGAVSVEGEDIAAMCFGIGGVWLRFATVTAGPEGAGGALPRIVSYQLIRRRAPGASGVRYWLHRTVVRAGGQEGRPGTWETGWNLDPMVVGAFMHSTPDNDGAVAGDPHGVVRPAAEENMFADGVVDFGVRLLEPAPDGNWRVLFPTAPDGREYLAQPVGRNLQAADLMVRVLTVDGARRLATFEEDAGDPGAAAGWWEIVRANSVTATRRVFLPGGGR